MIVTTKGLAEAIREYLEDRSTLYLIDAGDDRLRIDGTLDVRAMAADLASQLDECPCDCTEGEYTGRWTSGDFSGEGPLRSAYTCAEHSGLVAAWCHLGTGIAPTFLETSRLVPGWYDAKTTVKSEGTK